MINKFRYLQCYKSKITLIQFIIIFMTRNYVMLPYFGKKSVSCFKVLYISLKRAVIEYLRFVRGNFLAQNVGQLSDPLKEISNYIFRGGYRSKLWGGANVRPSGLF